MMCYNLQIMHENGSHISRGQQALRFVTERFGSATPFFRREVLNTQNLQTAIEIAQNYPLLTVLNHPSQLETIQALQDNFREAGLRFQRIIMPVSEEYHWPGVSQFASIFGVKVFFIATEKYVRKEAERGRTATLNDGLPEFVSGAMEGMKKGENVVMFLHPTRTPTLYPALPQKVIGHFLAQAHRRKIEMGVFLVGVGIKGADDYSKKRGFNPFETYIYNYGSTIMSSDLVKKAGGFGNVDALLHQLLEPHVPPNYIGPKPEQAPIPSENA